MVKKIILIALLAIGSLTVKSQQYLATLKQQGGAMVTAATTGNYKLLLKYTHPAVIKAMGGPEKAYQLISVGMDQIKASGASFEKAAIGNHQQLIVGKTNIQCILPQIIDMKISGKKIHTLTHLFCITYNGGKDWFFTDAGGANEIKVRQMIPEMSSKLSIPKSEMTNN